MVNGSHVQIVGIASVIYANCETPPCVFTFHDFNLTQSRLRQHLQKLVLGAHVDRLSDQLAFAIVDKTLGNAVDVKQIIYLASRIQQDWICYRSLSQEWLHLSRIFVINRK